VYLFCDSFATARKIRIIVINFNDLNIITFHEIYTFRPELPLIGETRQQWRRWRESTKAPDGAFVLCEKADLIDKTVLA
jgi:hypothetical protein